MKTFRRVAAVRGFFKERRGRVRGGGAALCLGFVLVVGSLLPGDASAQVPDAPWRTLSTEHFRVTYTPGLEPLARRAADRAEAAWTRLSELFLEAPPGKTDILLTDHTDISNGFARVTPSKRIVVFAPPPVADPSLGYFDEWMELVITHEVVHVFQLDRPGALGRALRAVFGRVPARWPFFPGFDTPRWAIEGMATWYESSLTESGRVEGTFHEAMLRTALLEGRFEELDRASGDSPVWPSGTRAYLYGSRFFDHLLEVHGEEKMGAFARAVAGQWIPYRLDAAGKDAFGVTISEAWAAWTDTLRARWEGVEEELARQAPLTRSERLTPGSRIALNPRVGPGGRLAYARADGRSDPQLTLAGLDGSDGRELVHTNGVATFDWLPDGDLLLSQLERDGPYRTYGDLYRVDGEGEGLRRLTRGQRLSEPSAFPDGRGAVAVQGGGGSTSLVRVSLEDGTVSPLVPADPHVHWARPAVSPDGRWVAATRWSPGAFLDVVVLDATTGREVSRLTRDRAMDYAPAWSPDGRWLLWTSDRTGIHNLLGVAMDPDTGRPVGRIGLVTNVVSAAAYASVSPEGTPGGPWIHFSEYHSDGWEVARIPFEPERWSPAPEPRAPFLLPDTTAPAPDPRIGGQEEPYSPLPTLLPRHWEPLYEEPVRSRALRTEEFFVPSRDLLGPSLGAETSGEDLVGRHAWNAFARWHLDGGGRVDGSLAWSWAGLGNPVLSASVAQRWGERGTRLVVDGSGVPADTLFLLERERIASLSATLRRARFRSDMTLSLGAGVVRESVEVLDARLDAIEDPGLGVRAATLSDVQASFRWSTVRSYALQMGGSDGASLFLRGRSRIDLDLTDAEERAGLDRSLRDAVVEVRAFRALGGPGHASHVLALRGAGGVAAGPGAGAGHFGVGGASGQEEGVTGFGLFGGDPLFYPVRGYPRNVRFGRRAWSASAEYRFPLAVVHRGLGAWPAHLDRITGALFVDAGNGWGPDVDASGFANPRRDPLASVGAEVTADTFLLWNEPLRLRAGWALPLVEGAGAGVYLRVGLSF